MTGKVNSSHRPELDALRGIAAMIVVVSHGANDGLLPREFGQGFGQMGVGVFYVLSAFLLTILYTPSEPDALRRHDYFVRRFARVLPLFYAAMAFSILLQIASGQSVYPVLKSLNTFLGNVFLVQGSSVLWSIPVELHFYVVFLIFWALVRRSALFAVFALIAFQMVSLAVLAVADVESTLLLPYWMHFFTIGCVFGIIARQPELRARVFDVLAVRILVIVAVAALPFALPEVRRMYLGTEPLATFADPFTVTWVVAFSALLIFGIVPPRWLDNRVLRYMGEVSFSVYLLHYFVLKPMTVVTKEDLIFPGDRFLIVLIVVYISAGLVNRLLERPAQKTLLRCFLPRHKPLIA